MSTTADNKDLGDVRRFLGDEEDPDLPPPDAPLGQIAISNGYLSEAQLEECLEEQKNINPRLLLGEILLRRKLITSEQLLRMLASQKKKRTPPPMTKPTELPEGARIGKYLLIREIGRGGMGVVYEAEDPDLKRRVAVKILKEDAFDPTSAERLRREAAIAAQLRHPGIVTVHEVGATQSLAGPQLPFIVMDLIQGRTLEDVQEEGKTPRPELLRILEDVARAVGHAHLKGVIHRDLKPTNVLIEDSGRVVLSDFGIARAPDFQSKLTQTRFVMGTPEYMAPEQIDGDAEKVGPACDVYALGVMAYRILAGRPPFQADTPVKLFQKILGSEPPPPRKFDPRVERDLEIICLKALEKSPARRYPTGEAFAEDLRRFRRGEPILGRPAGTMYRWGRRISRRRTPIAIAAAGLLLTFIVGWSFGAWARRERAIALEQLRGRLDTSTRAALEFRRAGNLERMRSFSKEAEEACADAMRRFPDLAEPYALQGRMHRTQMEHEKALVMQEAALARDPFSSLARYERVVLTSRLYRRRTDELVERAWRSAGERLIGQQHGDIRAAEITIPPRSKLAKADPRARELRAQLEADLRALGESIGGGERLCARGLLAWLADDLATARGLLALAVARAPLLEEAVEALATLEQEAANYEASVDVWTRGLEHDKSYLPHLEGRGVTRLTWGYARSGRGEDPTAIYDAAIADFTELIAKDKSRDVAFRSRGLARFLSGHHQLATKLGNPQEAYQAAVADLTQAIQLNPRSAETRMWRGVVRAVQGLYGLFTLQDSMPVSRAALEDLTEAIALNPNGDEAYMWRALARVPLSIDAGLRKGDPEPIYNEAMADFEQALRKNPGRAETWMWRGVARSLWASYLWLQGRDPRATYRQSLEDLDIALAKSPPGGEPLEWRGRVLILLGQSQENQNEDPFRSYEDALACFEKSLALNPKSTGARIGRGHARLRQGAARALRGQDPTADYEAAIKDLSDAAGIPGHGRALRAEAYVRRGQHKASKGEAPDSDYQAALADGKKALENNLFDTEACIWQGRARALQAPGRVSPLIHLQDAIGDFNRVLFFSPDHAQALAFRGDAFRARGIIRSGRIQEAAPEFQSALNDYQHALKVRPGLARELKDAIDDCKARLEKK